MFWTQRAFQLEVIIPGGNADEIYAYIRSMKHIIHHSLIREWKLLAPDNYLIVDRVRLWGLSLRVPYRGRITVLDDGTLRLEGFQRIVYIDNRTNCLPQPDGCMVCEQVTVHTLFPLARFVVAQTEKAHRDMLNGIKAQFAQAR